MIRTTFLRFSCFRLSVHSLTASQCLSPYLSSPTQVLSKDQSVELFSMYPEANSTICSNLLFDFDLDDEGKPIPGVEDDLTDRDKIDTKTRILNAL